MTLIPRQPCPVTGCTRLHGVLAVSRDQTQRSGRPDLAAALGSVARSRDEGAQIGVPDRAPGPAVATPVAANPMPIRSRQPEAPSPAGG